MGKGFMIDPDGDCIINREVIPFPSYDRSKFPFLYDMKLKSKDGNIFQAHKCILVARLEYFKLMLSGNWIEVEPTDADGNAFLFTSSEYNF